MKRLALALVACLALPAMADQPDAARAALMIDAIRGNGCAMTEAEAAVMLPRLGLEQDETVGFVEVLASAGHVTLSEDHQTLHLSDALCAAQAADDAALFAAALAGFEAAMPPGPPSLSEDEILGLLRDSLGAGFVRGAAELLAEGSGCAIDFSVGADGRDGLIAYLSEYLAAIYGLTLPLPRGVTAELGVMVEAFRREPGPFFAEQDGRLVLDGCEP